MQGMIVLLACFTVMSSTGIFLNNMALIIASLGYAVVASAAYLRTGFAIDVEEEEEED